MAIIPAHPALLQNRKLRTPKQFLPAVQLLEKIKVKSFLGKWGPKAKLAECSRDVCP